jgi:hypothetical protein
MVDLANDRLISLSEAAKMLGVHLSTIHRWRLRGCAGQKLLTLKIGGTRRVAVSALLDFAKRTTCAADGQAPQFSMHSPSRRERDLRAAEQALSLDGI